MSRRGNGEWSFTQRKDKIWTARKQFGYKGDQKPNIVAFYGKTKTEVRDKAKIYEESVTHSSSDVSKITFEEYFLRWMKLFKLGKVKPTTYDTIDFCLSCRIKPYPQIARAQMHQLSATLLQNYFNELAASNKYSYATIKKTKDTINNCLEKAVLIKDIAYNPMTGVELVSEEQLQKETKVIEFFEDLDIQKLIQESTKTTESIGGYKTAKYYKPLCSPKYRYGHHVVFLMQTGIRIGEALALKWGNVDFENKKVSIETNLTASYDRDENGQKQKVTLKEGSTKTKKSVRMVPLSLVATNALREIQNQNSNGNELSDFIFITKNGANPTAKNICSTLNAMQRNAMTKIQNSGLHVLRHTFASMLIRHGVDIKIVSELLGHKKISTTYDIYVSLIDKQKYDAIQFLDTMNSIILKPTK